MEFPITVENQEAFDQLVSARIERERKKFSDYDDLKDRASTAETAIANLTKRAETAEGRVTELESAAQLNQWRTEVSKEAGVPVDALRGSTREELASHAEVLKGLIAAQATTPTPTPVPTAGQQPNTAPKEDPYAALADALTSSVEHA